MHNNYARPIFLFLMVTSLLHSSLLRGKIYTNDYAQGRSLRGGKGGNCPPWDFQFLWFFKLIIPKSNTEIATWYLLRRHCPPAYLGQATALMPINMTAWVRLCVNAQVGLILE